MDYSKQKPIWSWKSNSDPWASDVPEQWTSYSDIQNEIIEEAYQAGKECVTINDHDIYPKTMLQILKTDTNKQRPIKRVLSTKVEEGLRNERFFLPPTKNYSFNKADIYWYPPLVRHWMDKNGHDCSDASGMPNEIVEVIAKGIISEGSLLGEVSEAEWMAEQLRKTSLKDREAFYKCCVMLYTRESFLYKVVNKALREGDMTKADTLGPFCFFLNQLPTFYLRDQDSKYRYEELVYRGANLTVEMVKNYKRAMKNGEFIAWDAFTSTTKDRKIAEKFGNTLFVIRMAGDWGNGYGCDIEALSVYPHEKEVLLPASAQLTVDRVAKERKENGKYIIYLARRDEGA